MLRVSEEIVWAGANEIRPADFGVGDGKLGLLGGGAGRVEELLAPQLLCLRVDVLVERLMALEKSMTLLTK